MLEFIGDVYRVIGMRRSWVIGVAGQQHAGGRGGHRICRRRCGRTRVRRGVGLQNRHQVAEGVIGVLFPFARRIDDGGEVALVGVRRSGLGKARVRIRREGRNQV